MNILNKRSTSSPSLRGVVGDVAIRRRCRLSVIPECFCRESMVNKTPLSRAAFTLVELVITIAIVIILSVISVPIYRGYVEKAKMSEGYALLGTILSAQKSYYSEYGNFYGFDENGYYTIYNEVLGIDARGNKYFTCFTPGWYRTHHGSLKNHFYAEVRKPNDLISDTNHRIIAFLYNITTGSTFQEYEFD